MAEHMVTTDENCCGLYQGHPRSGTISCCRTQDVAEKGRCGAYAEYGFNEGKGCAQTKGHVGDHGFKVAEAADDN